MYLAHSSECLFIKGVVNYIIIIIIIIIIYYLFVLIMFPEVHWYN